MTTEEAHTTLQINETIRRVHQGVVGADTRADLEAAVSQVFADSDPYVFAWIGEYDADADEIEPRAVGGKGAEYLDEISIAVHRAPDAKGPTATAVRTGTVQAMQHIRTDPDYEPWRANALAHGFESSAAVPIADDTADFGVLNLYSDRPAAFSEREQALLADLGETIATAIDGVEARRELAAQKRRYERLTERVSDAYYAVDDDWTVTYWNDQMAERTGRSTAAVVGECLWEAFPDLLGTEAERAYRAAMESGERRSFETYLESPYDYWVAVDVFPDEDGLSVFSREVTERKERERELARAKRRLDAVVQNTSEAIYIKDGEGRYLFINEVGADVFGSDPETVVGQTDADLFDPESAEDIRLDDRRVTETGVPETWDRVRYVDGEKHVFIDNKFPYRDESGDVVGLMGVSRDITDRKDYERRLERQRDDLELLNETVRHDTRNDLEVIVGYAEVLADRADEDSREHVETLLGSARAAVELTHSAGDLSEVMLDPDRDPAPVSLSDTLSTQVEETRAQTESARIDVEGTVPEVSVLADEMLDSVFRNLLKNAVQHGDKTPTEVTVAVTEGDDTVRVSVADNGPGVPETLRSTVFGKGEKGLDSRGTGIGLYLVRTLVDSYGGDVWVEDNDPEGAVFVVELPVA